ncbi:MAG: hypothetical protein EOM46_21960, partial [Gammaproteobacteria bacterium]|nr:hypothetical protein [Gammaproteobacteria bacterium]
MKLLLIGSQASNNILRHPLPVLQYTSLPDVIHGTACFILDPADPQQQDALLIHIRQHPHWFAFPVFTVQPSPLSPYLSDGLPPDDLLIRIILQGSLEDVLDEELLCLVHGYPSELC